MLSNQPADRLSYQSWLQIQNLITSPLDRTGPYWKYVMSAYVYYRSRLVVPGRAYDNEDVGMLAIGGGAHCDVMDLEQHLATQSDAARGEAYEWTLDTSPETVAYWRGMGRGNSARTVARRREEIAASAANAD